MTLPTLSVTLPPMPVKVVEVRNVATGPADVVCSYLEDGKRRGCGRFMLCVSDRAVVGGCVVAPVLLGGVLLYECPTCWRAVEVRWTRPEETK